MSFSVDELRRLSEAATQADQRISHEVFRGLSVLGRADLLREKACTFEAMAAYLGTHREAILRMLEAADALAAVYDECRRGGCPMCRPMHDAADDYKKARGE